MDITVIRKERVIDTVFTASVATLVYTYFLFLIYELYFLLLFSLFFKVSIIYINFGCALNWATVKATLKKPIAPAIGFVGQFLFMPVVKYFTFV